jgi:pimeloyl-ACP methyl ester carboxylesterase
MLAARLSEAGFPVLRFEYRGCGNAGGSYDDMVLNDWIADIERAIEELAHLSDVSTVTLAGIRLGASLSALAAGALPAADAALLWDPVLDGTRYISELEGRHAHFLRGLPRGGAPEADGEGTEILGFRLGPQLVQDIGRIAPTGLGRALATKQVLLLEGGAAPTGETDRQTLAARCGGFLHCREPADQHWLDDPHQIFLPGKAIGEIATWMKGLC